MMRISGYHIEGGLIGILAGLPAIIVATAPM